MPASTSAPLMTGEPTEIELKLELDPADAGALIAAPLLAGTTPTRSELVSTYLDTPDDALRTAGYALRIRQDGARWIQTLKAEGAAAAGLFVRPEWECDLDDASVRLDPASGPLADIFPPDVLARLVPRFETRVTRTLFDLSFEGAQIECALDEGMIVAGDRRAPLSELELELRSGAPRALFDLARALDGHAPLRLGTLSKSARGYALAADKPRRLFKAEPILLDPDGDARDAFATIAQSCIRQFRLNEALLTVTGEAAALHQARVGLRRLRSAFSLFKALFAEDPEAALFRLALKTLAADLGEVRNLDVLIPRVDAAVRPQLEVARAGALDHVRVVLASARTRLLMIDLAEWLTTGDWRLQPADPDIATRPAREAASDILDRHRRRIKRRGRHLATLDDEHRHAVRIEGKKLRYAAEFFAALYPAKKQQRRHEAFLVAIEALQDQLGELNDLVTGPEVLATLGIEAPLRKVDKHERKRLLERAEDALDTLLDVKRFWR